MAKPNRYVSNPVTSGLAIPEHDGVFNTYDGNGQLATVKYYVGTTGVNVSTYEPTGGTLVATLTMTYNGSNLMAVVKS